MSTNFRTKKRPPMALKHEHNFEDQNLFMDALEHEAIEPGAETSLLSKSDLRLDAASSLPQNLTNCLAEGVYKRNSPNRY